MKPQTEVVTSIIAYSICSGSLVLINKLILHYIPFPSLVVSVQFAATVSFIYTAKLLNKLPVDELEWKYIVPYLYYIVAFALGVFCNMQSLSRSNVETVIVFRALSPCLVSILDALFLGREWPSRQSWAALGGIVLGAYGYALHDVKFQEQGMAAYFWPLCYLLLISFEMAYGKRIIASVDLKTKSGPVLYTNLLGIAPMLGFAVLAREPGRFMLYPEAIPLIAYCLLLLGCAAGTGIGYASWWCRDQVSATSFTLIGVLNKVLTVTVNACIWDQHANTTGILCLFVSLVFGTLYRQAPLRSESQVAASTIAAANEDVWEMEDDEHVRLTPSRSNSFDEEEPLVKRVLFNTRLMSTIPSVTKASDRNTSKAAYTFDRSFFTFYRRSRESECFDQMTQQPVDAFVQRVAKRSIGIKHGIMDKTTLVTWRLIVCTALVVALIFSLLALASCEFVHGDESSLGIIRSVDNEEGICHIDVRARDSYHLASQVAAIVAPCAHLLSFAFIFLRLCLSLCWIFSLVGSISQALTLLVYCSRISLQSRYGTGSTFSIVAVIFSAGSALLALTVFGGGKCHSGNSSSSSESEDSRGSLSLVGSEISFPRSASEQAISSTPPKKVFRFDKRGRKILLNKGSLEELGGAKPEHGHPMIDKRNIHTYSECFHVKK